MNGTQLIETERLVLRAFEMSDATACYDNLASDEAFRIATENPFIRQNLM